MALHSMTGFGRARVDVDDRAAVVVEIKSVNHKGLDIKCRLPRALSAEESSLIAQVKSRVERGRIDMSVDVEVHAAATFAVDAARVRAVVDAARALAAEHPDLVTDRISALELMRMPGVIAADALAAVDPVALAAATNAAVVAAVAAFVDARAREGAGLAAELQVRSTAIAQHVSALSASTSTSTSDKRQRLTDRLRLLDVDDLDPARIAQEVALLAERLDVSEELARLGIHVQALNALLIAQAPGRKLDFLCQELLREANTTASKCQDARTAHLVVDLKAEIERLREQAQNVE